MYQSHFHLHVRPFSSAANPEHYYPASSIEQARESIARNVERAASVTIVTGPVGSGKTLLCQLIANQYANEFPVCLVQGERLDQPEVLFQSILHKLGIPFRGQDAGELRIILSDHISSPGCVNGILLIIDDADRLNEELLDEVRSITNIVKDGQPCARVVLAGSPRLDENLGAPALESLNQRVAGRHYLENFSHHETSDYIGARITSSGGDAGALFTDDALHKVQQATNGVPRLVNQICDHALMLASVNHVDQLNGQLIEEAWADLQQLPLPLPSDDLANATNELNEAVIEFGELEDPTETSELDKLQEALADLSVTATRATRPIVVGGDVQFESDVAMEESYEDAVLPIRSPLVDDEDLQGTGTHSSHSLDGPIFGGSDSGDQGDSQQFHFEVNEFDVADEDSQTFVFDSQELSDASDEANLSTESAGDDSGENASAEDLMDSVQEQVASELSDLEGESEENSTEAEFEFSFETGDEAAVDWNNSHIVEPHEASASEEEHRHDEHNEVDDDEYQLAQIELERESQGVPEVSHEQASDETDGEFAEQESQGEFESHEFTIEQAANPFAVEFDEEEIVVQNFTSPSQLARGDYDPVTSAYSRQLAAQLSSSHPGLRVHPAIEISSLEFEDEQDSFQPLSACMENESYLSTEEDSPSSAAGFVGKHDPVMPDPFVRSLVADGVTAESEIESEGVVGSIGVEVEAELPAIQSEKKPPKKRTRIFRTLFSGMRSK